MKPKKRTSTTFIAVRPEDGKVLMQHRDDKPGIRHRNAWCFPGETPQAGETPLATVIRGLKEEYNITVGPGNCQLLTVYTHDVDEVDSVFFVELPAGAEPELREGKAMAFKSLEEIRGMKLGFEGEKLLSLLEE